MSGKEQLQADKTAETSMKHHEEKQDILGQMETVNYLEFVWIDDLKIKRRYGKESKIGVVISYMLIEHRTIQNCYWDEG